MNQAVPCDLVHPDFSNPCQDGENSLSAGQPRRSSGVTNVVVRGSVCAGLTACAASTAGSYREPRTARVSTRKAVGTDASLQAQRPIESAAERTGASVGPEGAPSAHCVQASGR